MLLLVGVIADSNVVFEGGRIDLLVLADYHETADSNQLKLLSLDLVQRQVSVDERYCDEESLGFEFEFLANIDEPVYQYGSHLLVNISLATHVVALRPGLSRLLHHDSLNGLEEGIDILYINDRLEDSSG